MNPEIKSKLNGYIIKFHDEGIIATVNNCRLHSRDGRVTGELSITTNSEEPIILLPSEGYNFSKQAPSRTRDVNDLTANIDLFDDGFPIKKSLQKINWTEVFGFLAHKIQELARTGEEVSEVWASDEIVPVEWFLEPLIIKGQPNVIYGEKGVNKSTLAFICGAILCLAWEKNPLELPVCDNEVTSLVLDWERDRVAFDYYLARIKRGMNFPAFRLFYRRCNLPLLDDIEPIAKKIEQTGASLLIIDSLGRAAGGQDTDLKGSSAADNFLKGLRQLDITSLIIGQTSKPQVGEKGKRLYGSVFFEYYSGNILELCHSEDETGDTKHLALFHKELNFGKKSPPIGLRMDFHEDGGINVEREPVSIAEFSQKINTQARVLDVLKSGAQGVKEIAQALDISESNVRMVLSRLSKKGKIVKLGKEYGLTSDQAEF